MTEDTRFHVCRLSNHSRKQVYYTVLEGAAHALSDDQSVELAEKTPEWDWSDDDIRSVVVQSSSTEFSAKNRAQGLSGQGHIEDYEVITAIERIPLP